MACEHSATRREFVSAAALAAAAAGVPRSLADEVAPADRAAPIDASTLLNADGDPYGQPDDDGNVGVIATFMDIMEQVDYGPVASYTLPTGCVPTVSCPGRAAVVQANTQNRTLTRLGYLDFATGEYRILLEGGITGPDYSVSEARVTDFLAVWVEMENATQSWAFYACRFTGDPITTASPGLVKLGGNDGEWLPPQFDAVDSRVVWQVMPDPYGPYSTEHSHAYLWTLGAPQGDEVWDSPGRFACAPNISGNVLTIAPRVKADEGVYYGITAIDLARGFAQIDQLVMPVSVKPFFITYAGGRFAFSVEADYGWGGRLGRMGYYIGPGEGPFHYVYREPSSQINYVNGLYVVKSRLSYFVVDLDRRTYARITAASGCTDYGDYPATAGEVDSFVTYATVKDSVSGIPAYVLLRTFSLV